MAAFLHDQDPNQTSERERNRRYKAVMELPHLLTVGSSEALTGAAVRVNRYSVLRARQERWAVLL